MSLSGNKQLTALIAGTADNVWREELLDALACMAATLPDMLAELGALRADPQRWGRLWTRWPSQWKRFIKDLQAKTAEDPAV